MNLENIISYVSGIISIILFAYAVIMLMLNGIKNHRLKVAASDENEALEEKLEDRNATFKLLNEIIPAAIAKAESLKLDGPSKKLLAMSEILLKCSEGSIDFEMYKPFIVEQIENLIGFTKIVNKRDKDEAKTNG